MFIIGEPCSKAYHIIHCCKTLKCCSAWDYWTKRINILKSVKTWILSLYRDGTRVHKTNEEGIMCFIVRVITKVKQPYNVLNTVTFQQSRNLSQTQA